MVADSSKGKPKRQSKGGGVSRAPKRPPKSKPVDVMFSELERKWINTPRLTKREREIEAAKMAGINIGRAEAAAQHQRELERIDLEGTKAKRQLVERLCNLIDTTVRLANIMVGEDWGGQGGLLRHLDTPKATPQIQVRQPYLGYGSADVR